MSNRDENGRFVKGILVNDLTGLKFGKLTVLKVAPKTQRKTFYECVCDCGNKKVVRGDALTYAQCPLHLLYTVIRSAGVNRRRFIPPPPTIRDYRGYCR